MSPSLKGVGYSASASALARVACAVAQGVGAIAGSGVGDWWRRGFRRRGCHVSPAGGERVYQNLTDEIGAPDVVINVGCEQAVAGFDCSAPPEQVSGDVLVERLERLAVVEQARSIEAVSPYFVDAAGACRCSRPPTTRSGALTTIDRCPLLRCRAVGRSGQPMPFRLDGELPVRGGTGVVFALATAQREGIHIGDDVRLAGFCTGEDDGMPTMLWRPVDLTVTGVGVGPLDIEPPGTGLTIEPAYVDRAIIEQLVAEGAELQTYASVWLDPAASADARRTAV